MGLGKGEGRTHRSPTRPVRQGGWGGGGKEGSIHN